MGIVRRPKNYFYLRFMTIIAGGLLMLPLSALAGSTALVLVREGAVLTPIVVFENAPPKTRRAADELAEYIAKISGGRPQVIEGEPDPLPESAIWVGYQPALDGLFPDLDFDFQHPEEILIAVSSHHLVICGRDVWDPAHLVREAGRRTQRLEGIQQEYGTVNAVYTFLQDSLGVRWLWPGAHGTDIPARQTLALTPFVHRFHPVFRQRGDLFRLSTLGSASGGALDGRSQDWTRLQRLQLDSFQAPGGHAFTDWWQRFHETQPALFALQPDGTRSGFPSPHRVKLCQSNPDVWRQWLADVERQLETDPTRSVFNAAPNDSASSGICVCEHCVGWDHPDGEQRRYQWQGMTQEYVAMTDRYLTFTAKLAGLLRERFPDRPNYTVSQLAYHSSLAPPHAATVPDNVVIGFVGRFPFCPEPMAREQQAQWAEWAKTAPMLVYRPNLWYYTTGGIWGLPEIALRRTMADWRFLAEHGGIGFFIDTTREHWATQGPQYYLMAQLAWDPHADGEAILADYYQRAFGPAADLLAAYWDVWEQAVEQSHAVDGFAFRGIVRNARLIRQAVYTDALLDHAQSLLDQAADRLADAPQIYRDRLAFVRAGLSFTRLFFETLDQVQAAAPGDALARQAIEANREAMRQLIRAFPIGFQGRIDRDDARGLGWLRAPE